MEEASLPAWFEVYGAEELLQDDQPGERGQCLIFKLNIGQRMGFTLNFGSARFPNKPL